MRKVTPGMGLGRGKGRAPIFDRDEMVRLYVHEDMGITDIAIKMNTSYMTIHRGLQARGVLLKKGKGRGGGRPKALVCAKGHDQSVWRREDNRGRGFCGKCKTIRDKGYKK